MCPAYGALAGLSPRISNTETAHPPQAFPQVRHKQSETLRGNHHNTRGHHRGRTRRSRPSLSPKRVHLCQYHRAQAALPLHQHRKRAGGCCPTLTGARGARCARACGAAPNLLRSCERGCTTPTTSCSPAADWSPLPLPLNCTSGSSKAPLAARSTRTRPAPQAEASAPSWKRRGTLAFRFLRDACNATDERRSESGAPQHSDATRHTHELSVYLWRRATLPFGHVCV